MKASLFFILFFLFACDNSTSIDLEQDRTLAVLYTQSSAEHMAASIATYENAKQSLRTALADKNWTALPDQKEGYQNLPPAIIIDVDDTVLDNSAYEARIVLNKESYPVGWGAWCHEAIATGIPGAISFLNEAARLGVEIFYVTNRKSIYEESTKENFKKLDIPFSSDIDSVLSRGENGWTSDKSSRRELIASSYRVLLQIGDNLGDFVSESSNHMKPYQRKQEVLKHQDKWGKQWFVIENPTYGDWEAAIYDYNFEQPPESIRSIRRAALDPKNK